MVNFQKSGRDSSALVGATGYVGQSLLTQRSFSHQYSSRNIAEIQKQEFSLVVCCAAPAKKWIANRQPEADRQNIEALTAHLETVTCDHFVLISTVDVFQLPLAVSESSPVDEQGLHAYGLNRRLLEKFVENHFPNHLIVRLPGLVGPGLRKNVVFDFLHQNNLHDIDSRGVFQFYPMVNLWYDIQTALQARLSLVHLTAEPISVATVAEQGFNRTFVQETVTHPALYDMRTEHAALFGGTGTYQYSQRESIQAIRAYAQSEPLKVEQLQGAR